MGLSTERRNTDPGVISFSPAPATPEQALAALYEGNRRFAEGHPTAPHRDMHRLRDIAGNQKPLAAFLGCADSRVPVEIVFDQGLGDLFVNRVAGNVATSETIASLEFGTEVLGAQVIFILGHSRCGAVRATAEGAQAPGQISTLYSHIRPAVTRAGGDVVQAVMHNVRLQGQTLVEASAVIRDRLRSRELIVAGGVYDVTTALVTPVDLQLGGLS